FGLGIFGAQRRTSDECGDEHEDYLHFSHTLFAPLPHLTTARGSVPFARVAAPRSASRGAARKSHFFCENRSFSPRKRLTTKRSSLSSRDFRNRYWAGAECRIQGNGVSDTSGAPGRCRLGSLCRPVVQVVKGEAGHAHHAPSVHRGSRAGRGRGGRVA